MKLLFASVLLALNTAAALAGPLDRIQGLGKDRENLTPQQLTDRMDRLMQASEFWLLRRNLALEAPGRIFYPANWAMFQAAGAEYGADPYMIAALAFVESYGNPTARSPTGPLGIMQFTKARGQECGLRQYATRQRVEEEKLVWKGRGKNRRQVLEIRTRSFNVTVDERLDPEKSVNAAARCLAQAYRRFGRWDFAIQEHHNGNGRIRKMIQLYTGEGKITDKNVGQIIARHNLTFAHVLFGNTPYFRPKLFEYLEDIRMTADFAPTYSPRVFQAMALLKQYQQSPAAYLARFNAYRSLFKDDLEASNRMWYFFKPEDVPTMQFASLQQVMDAGRSGRLVPLPEPWEDHGIVPRLTGKSPIAEKDMANQREYIRADMATVGSLLYVMNELRLLQGQKFEAYETNSLVRTTQTQEALLKDPGTKASSVLRTHEWGKAFDVPVLDMDKDRQRDLLFILTELDSYGLISFVPEHALVGKGRRRKALLTTYHVVPHPSESARFERAYSQAVGYTITTTSTTKQ